MALVAVLGYVLDQLTKMLAVAYLDPHSPPSYLGGFLKLKLIRNPGAAFSMGTQVTELLSILSIAALLFCLVWLTPRIRRPWQGALLGMGVAGIAGNLTDRLFRGPGPLRGHVIDFFALPNFAIFNVADIFLTTAAVIVIGWTLVVERREKAAAASASDEREA